MAKATRQSFGEAVARLAAADPRIVVLDADLGKSTMTGEFAKKFPDRHFEFGIAEQNMIGTAAGLATCGKIPFATSFACFLVGRYETIRMSVSYMNTNVRLIGTHAGVGIGEDGNSQMGLEDVAVLRSLPNLTIIQPGDDIEAQQAIERSLSHDGPVYFRLTRQKLPDLHGPDYKFQWGKLDLLLKEKPNSAKKGVAIFATGGVVANALTAAKNLAQQGVATACVNVPTLHPFDSAAAVSIAKEFGRAITVEDHYTVGGLGSAVAEALADAGAGVPLHRVGVERFGESGSPEALYEMFGFSATALEKKFLSFLG